eukprot:TRINITY_DN3821_c0_g3_i2.p1 TRINITY_DN3821_c0_g3~~TRINITY_DN3821_c0_g3_i2.p1  ORF type:complete len:171 (+),score=27.64 TRINITY_DN3821_c0_g3_i2:510-1022(+)
MCSCGNRTDSSLEQRGKKQSRGKNRQKKTTDQLTRECVMIVVLLITNRTYVDDSLVGSGFVSDAAIFGHDGSEWATSSGLNVSADEVAALLASLNDNSSAFSSGLVIGGVKYMCIRIDDNTAYGKKGQAGVTIYKTGQALIIGTHSEDLQGGNCEVTVGKVADYLIELGY